MTIVRFCRHTLVAHGGAVRGELNLDVYPVRFETPRLFVLARQGDPPAIILPKRIFKEPAALRALADIVAAGATPQAVTVAVRAFDDGASDDAIRYMPTWDEAVSGTWFALSSTRAARAFLVGLLVVVIVNLAHGGLEEGHRDPCRRAASHLLPEARAHERSPRDGAKARDPGLSGEGRARDRRPTDGRGRVSRRRRVLPAGYSFSHARDVLAGGFVAGSWPFGAPYPALYFDTRALVPGPPYASLHAKCVVVDDARAFLSSANFTQRGQERNIEAGVLLHDVSFATHLARQEMGLVAAGHVVRSDVR